MHNPISQLQFDLNMSLWCY